MTNDYDRGLGAFFQKTQWVGWGRLALKGALVPVLSAFLAMAAGATEAPPMALSGKAGVTAGGAFTYNVPIAVPPGSGGMAPVLSLEYSSQAGDGILGLGWKLLGLPSIGRCPRTIAQDSVRGSVNYDANDRFCMEGLRLMAVSGTYGADQTEYRTEVEGFSKVVSYGVAGTGPAWFKVWTKSGQVLELGNSTDSRILVQAGTTARSWMVNKVSDRKGNYLTVTYTNDTTNGTAYPTRIDYTGNAAAGLSPYNSVRFTYNTNRPDQVPLYHAGALQKTTVLLTNVKAYEGNNVVRDYQITYELGTTLRRSRITQIQVCDNVGNCLAPTTFGWQGTRDTITFTGGSPGGLQKPFAAADFNGDGLSDPLTNDARCPSNGVTNYAGTLAGTFSTTNYAMSPAGGGSPTPPPFCVLLNGAGTPTTIADVADFDGDGLSDWGTSEAGAGGALASNFYYSDGVGMLYQAVTTSAWPDPVYTYLGDFNGDGRADFFHRASGATSGTPYYSNGRSGTTSFSAGSSLSGFGGTVMGAADFDGNGCSDVLQQGTVSTITFWCDPAVGSLSVTNWAGVVGNKLVVGDFNGDGNSDIVILNNNTTGTLQLSTGTGFVQTAYTVPSGLAQWSSHVAADVNGDGRADLVLIGKRYQTGFTMPVTWNTLEHRIYLSTGTGFVFAAYIANENTFLGGVSDGRVADWNSDGAVDLWLRKLSGDAIQYVGYTPEFMNSVSNGLGITTTVTYDRLNKPPVYTKDTNASYPTVDVNGSLYVVSRLDEGDGVGGNYASTYKYVGLKADLQGRGSLGFRQQITTDLQTNIVETTTFRQDYPYVGFVASQTATLGSITLSSRTNTLAATSLGGTRYFVSLTQTVDAVNDLNGTALPTVTTAYQYDAFGNPTQITVTTPNGDSKVTTNTYTNDAANWVLGLITTATQTNTVGGVAVTRQTSYAYNTTTGQMTQEVAEPNAPSLRQQNDYVYDAFGNRTSASISGTDIVTRTTSSGFDTQGRFAVSSTNALNQSASGAFDARHGGVTSSTDLNALVTTATYDAFGRGTLRTEADGTKSSAAYAYCSGVNGGTASCPSGAAFVVTNTPLAANGTTQIGAQVKVYHDGLSRAIARDTQGFDGSLIRVSTQYDALGRLAQVSRPYFVSGGTQKWKVNSYDALGRIVDIAMPNGGHVTTTYNGLTTTVTNALGQVTTTTRNQQEQIASMTDNSGTTAYVYDPFNNVKTITDANGNVTTFTYDTRGRKTAGNDPDLGVWQYAYNVIGELVSQTDAKNQTTTLSYDKLGRVTQRVEVGLTSTFTYDTATKGVGKLAADSASNGASHTYAYDILSRPSSVTTTVDGNSYSVTTTYDAYSRPDVMTYPSGFAVKHEYTSLGYLSRMLNNATSTALWTANAVNAELQVTQQMAGNGVVTNRTYDANTGEILAVQAGVGNAVANFSFAFNTLGSLTSRADAINSLTENFSYDNMNRLTQYAIVGGSTKTVGYSAIGNIASKSDVGTYAYPSSGAARPHAIGSITGTVNTIFTYDANGNMIAGQGRTVTYTSFNMAASITQGSATVNFTYDANHERIKLVAPEGTTVYVAGATGIERFAATSGLVTWNEYLIAGGQRVGLHFTRSDSTQNTRHFVTDHLGSISVITDEMGAVVERLSYDAWGKRRHPNGADDPTNAINSQTTRGFTGHEHIASVGLINMNARIYDPLIGRFMSADPQIDEPYFSQQLNRYSYVGNNPLSIVDPTGRSWLSKIIRAFFRNPIKFLAIIIFSTVIGPEIGLALANTLGIAGTAGGAFVAGFVAGFTSGVFVGAINGEKFWAALRNGLWNGLSAGLGKLAARWQTTKWSIAMRVRHSMEYTAQRMFGVDGFRFLIADLRDKITHWDQVAAKALLLGAKDALIANLRNRPATGAFFQGAAFALAREVYDSFLPYEDGPPLFGSGNGPGSWKKDDSSDLLWWGKNNWGVWCGNVNESVLCEGSALSNVIDGAIPFMRGTSYLHDVWTVFWKDGICLGTEMCAHTMLPAFAVTVGATLRDAPIGANPQSGQRRRRSGRRSHIDRRRRRRVMHDSRALSKCSRVRHDTRSRSTLRRSALTQLSGRSAPARQATRRHRCVA